MTPEQVISLKDDFRKKIILKPFSSTFRSLLKPSLAFSLNNQVLNVKCEELYEMGQTGHHMSQQC